MCPDDIRLTRLHRAPGARGRPGAGAAHSKPGGKDDIKAAPKVTRNRRCCVYTSHTLYVSSEIVHHAVCEPHGPSTPAVYTLAFAVRARKLLKAWTIYISSRSRPSTSARSAIQPGQSNIIWTNTTTRSAAHQTRRVAARICHPLFTFAPFFRTRLIHQVRAP